MRRGVFSVAAAIWSQTLFGTPVGTAMSHIGSVSQSAASIWGGVTAGAGGGGGVGGAISNAATDAQGNPQPPPSADPRSSHEEAHNQHRGSPDVTVSPRERLDQEMQQAKTQHERVVAQDNFLAATAPRATPPAQLSASSPGASAPSYVDAKLTSELVPVGGHQGDISPSEKPAMIEQRPAAFVDPAAQPPLESDRRPEPESPAPRAARKAEERLAELLNQGLAEGDPERISADEIRALSPDARAAVEKILANRVSLPSASAFTSASVKVSGEVEGATAPARQPAGAARILAMTGTLGAGTAMPDIFTAAPDTGRKAAKPVGAVTAGTGEGTSGARSAAKFEGAGSPFAAPAKTGEAGGSLPAPSELLGRAKKAVARVLHAVRRRLGDAAARGRIADSESTAPLQLPSGMAPGDRIPIADGKPAAALAGMTASEETLDGIDWAWLAGGAALAAFLLHALGWIRLVPRKLAARRE